MSETERIYEYENVNGVTLCLKISMHDGTSHSRLFTVTYKNKENNNNNSSWSKMSLLFAVLFNMLALFYVQISFTALVIIILTLSFLLFFWITHSVQSESVLVIPSVGIQSSVTYVYGREDHYIPWPNVDDVIINEVIKFNRVLYFLTVLVKKINQDESMVLVPLFKYTKPRLMMLETIYMELQALLTEAHTREAYNEAGDMG